MMLESRTLLGKRSVLEVAAQRLATTEQSVNMSWTKSVVPEAERTGTVDCSSPWMIPANNCDGRFHPAKISFCDTDRCKSGWSLVLSDSTIDMAKMSERQRTCRAPDVLRAETPPVMADWPMEGR